MRMKRFQKLIFIFLTITVVFPLAGFSQDLVQNDSINSRLKDVAKEIMLASGTCALITQDHKGRSRVRTMDPFPPENDFTVWFGTNSKSRKVDQIKKNPRVTLYYFDNRSMGYVTLHGSAQIVNDPEEKEKRWKEEWEAFYPNKAEDYLLIKVSPEWMEIISVSHGIVGDQKTWKPPIILFDLKD